MTNPSIHWIGIYWILLCESYWTTLFVVYKNKIWFLSSKILHLTGKLSNTDNLIKVSFLSVETKSGRTIPRLVNSNQIQRPELSQRQWELKKGNELKEFWRQKEDCLSLGDRMWEKMRSQGWGLPFKFQQLKSLNAVTCVFTTRKILNKLKINHYSWAYQRNKATEQTTTPGKYRESQLKSVYLEQSHWYHNLVRTLNW